MTLIEQMARAMICADRIEGQRFSEYCQTMVRAALAEAERLGWRMVPPTTREMYYAGADALKAMGHASALPEHAAACFGAMLAAAPGVEGK